jgi:HAD superfamily hydrolase (TIGR01509 family)
VLWDNDGILVDSEFAFYEISRDAFASMGLDLTVEKWGHEFLGEGISSREMAREMGADPDVYRQVLDRRNARYRDMLRDHPPPVRSQVPETLQQLSGRVKLGVVTGSHRDQFEFMHRSSGLPDLFDVIITGDDHKEPKPDPGLYLAALEALGLPAGDCIAVEDTRRGLLAAVNAGIACVVVPTELTRMQDFSEALAVENEISAVLNYIGDGPR